MAITLEQIKAIQPMIKQGNSADDRTWTLNGQPVYQIPLKDGTPVFVPAAIYSEIQSNPSAYQDIVNVAPPELIAANGTPAWMAANGYMQVSGLPHAMEGAPAPGFMDSLMETAGDLLPYAGLAAIGGLASGALSSGGAAASGAASSGGMGAAGGAMGAVGSSGIPSWLTSLLPSPASGGAGAALDLSGAGAGGLAEVLGEGAGATTAGTGMGAAGGAMGAVGGGSSIAQTISAATGIPVSYLDAAGKLLPGVIGAIGANQQSNALSDLANKFDAYGAPSRARYEASMTPGFDPTTIPGYSGALDTASQSILRGMSASGGNPFGNPGGLVEANKAIVSGTALPAINSYQNQNANTGGLGALAASYPSAATGAVNSGAGVWNAIGGAAGDIFNPKEYTMKDFFKKWIGA